ncbi:PucR family transcriptional regulator [Paenibacillus naphthalenovorans]|uniref:PucR family transcriptional regulator n=1 Tax=Paenibacillus naphthalenovorans TaxID=162209 RepID=UPI003D2A6787
MHLTVEQALSIFPLSKGRLIAGKTGTSRIVKSVNVMDAPDITDWIKDGEMLFTTAYLIKDDIDEGIQLLRKLDQRGSAGLGIKLGRFWSDVPEPILDEADRLEFPLIELPYQFTFSDQMKGLFYAELQRNTKVLHSVLEKQKKLMQFALKPDHLSNFFHAILGIIGYPMAVVASRGHLVFNSTSMSEAQLLQGWPWKDRSQWVYSENGRHFCIPLTDKEEGIGYVLFYPTEPQLMKVEEGLFHQAAEIISYQMSFVYKEFVDQSVQNDLGYLLSRYLKGNGTIEALTEGAERLGIKLFEGSYQCVLAAVPPEIPESDRSKWLRDLREELKFHPELKNKQVIHFRIGEGEFSIFSADSFSGNGTLPALLAKGLQGLLGAVDATRRPRLSVSGRKCKPESLLKAFQECQDTQQIAERLGIRDPVIQFETVELAYLFQHVPDRKMQLYCDEVLQALLVKDPEYAREMLHTLEVFIDNDGQMNETAKQLYIHRNTAAYRLEKIGELLGVDYKSISDLLRLKLVFVFRQMLNS